MNLNLLISLGFLDCCCFLCGIGWALVQFCFEIFVYVKFVVVFVNFRWLGCFYSSTHDQYTFVRDEIWFNQS